MSCLRCEDETGPGANGMPLLDDVALHRVLPDLPNEPTGQNIWLCCTCGALASLNELKRRGRFPDAFIEMAERN